MTKSLKAKNWEDFCLDDLFKITSTSSGIDKCRLINLEGDMPYITRTDKNNGYELYVGTQDSKYKVDCGNVITIGLDTQTVFYQQHSFYTGQNIQILKSPHINKYTALFMIPMIKILMQKFNWGGNGATLTRLRRSRILLPVVKKGEPDYKFMEEYIKEREAKLKNQYKEHVKSLVDSLHEKVCTDKEWQDFSISKVFEIKAGKRLTKANMKAGNIPFIGATDSNNGITNFVSNENASTDKGVLGVNYNGSVVETFYHPYKCTFSDDVKRFLTKEVKGNKYIYLFLKNAILKQKCKYMYGYKFNENRMTKQRIMLPVNSKGEPDYKFMEDYMKYLEQKKLLEYLDYIK